MNKTLTFPFTSLLFTSYAQEILHCGTDEAMKKEFELHPELYQQFLEREALLEKQDKIDFENGYQSSPVSQKTSQQGTLYIIPVVFHILHQYGSENISDAQVYDQLKILNRDFRKLNADTSNIVAAFQGIAADAEIEFRLPTKDPNGNCTNGIIRHVDPNTNWPNTGSAYAYSGSGSGKWNPTKYLNVYVVKTISSGAAGYTYLPGTWGTGAASDAIVILHSYVGSVGTGNPSTSRALTHEIGHWLNLQHVWGSGNSPGVACGNDGVSDTPVTKGYTSCSLSNSKICNSTVEENVQNYMEYSYCSNMFSAGQKTRMRNAVTSTTGGRNNLWSATNLTATGVNPVGSPCAPIADFKSNAQFVCTNSNVSFTDLSWNGQPTSWNWSFPGANPSTSTDSMPIVQYTAPGVYAVSYTVTNAQGTNSITKNSYITVFSNTATYSGSWQEGFETSALPNGDWTINNSGGVTWTRTGNASVTGTYSMYLQNTSNSPLSTDEAISPSINMSSIGSPTMTFKLAYAQKNSSQRDYLKVLYSTNCGVTWAQKYNKSGSTLQTLGTGVYQSAAFTPTASQWRTETINVSNISFSQNVMFKFVFICDSSSAGNNIYIDDINIVGPVGIDNEIENTIDFNVYPNPARGQATVSFNLISNDKVRAEVTDVLGRKVETLINNSLDAGEYTFFTGMKSQYAPGIYFVNMQVGTKMFTRKVVIE